MIIKKNGYSFRGSNSAIFNFASLLNCSQLLQERICSIRSKFFHIRIASFLEGIGQVQDSKQEVTKVSPLCNKWQKLEMNLYTMIIIYSDIDLSKKKWHC